MSINLDPCYGNIIGLSRTTCSCYDGEINASVNTSDSDLFLDELEAFPFKAIEASADCKSGSLWDILGMAREEAIKNFKTDLLSCVQSSAKLRRPPFSGIIGDTKKANKWIALNKTYHGLRLRMADITAGFARLKRIGLFFDQTQTFVIDIYNNIDPDPIDTISVTTSAGELTWVDLPTVLTLDMDNQYGDGGLEYFFIFSPTSGIKARNTMITCGCGGGFKPDWNAKVPYYLTLGDKGNYQWANYVMATGTYGSDITNRVNWQNSNDTQGILLDIAFGCDTEKTLCNEEIDYYTNPFALVMAHAVRYRAGAWAINHVLASSNINRYTLMDGQTLAGIANNYMVEYNQRVFNYLCHQIVKPENINTNSDCFTCADPHGIIKTGILL